MLAVGLTREQFRERVRSVFAAFAKHGQTVRLVSAHPKTPFVGEIAGYTIRLDPRCPPGRVYFDL